jgi:hypothetical protein
MELFWQIFGCAALIIVAVVFLGFLYCYFIKFAHPREVAKAEDIKNNRWHTIPMKGNTRCSDGSAYEIYVRKGPSKHLMIYFAGGGACWDGYTASRPITLLSALGGNSRNLRSFYFSKLQWFYPQALGGIGDNKNTKNAFREWNFVFIPYCTGDMHIGDTIKTYSFNDKNIEIHHNGRGNSLAALNWVFDNYKDVNKIMVSGESTGAFASAFYAPLVADHYSDKKIYSLSDAAMLTSDRWNEILDTVWNSQSQKNLEFKIGADIFEDALIHRTDGVKRQIKYLHSNTLYDDVFTKFGAVLNHQSTATNDFIDQWTANTKASMRKLDHADIDYHYFITDWGYDIKKHTTQHTITTNEFYHKCTADGIPYAEWLKRNVIDDENLSLGQMLI